MVHFTGYAVVRGSHRGTEFLARNAKRLSSNFTARTPRATRITPRVISPAAVARLASLLIDHQKGSHCPGGKSDAQVPVISTRPHPLPDFVVRQNHGKNEIFGPLLPILTYSDLGRLLAKINTLYTQTACRLRVEPKSTGDRSGPDRYLSSGGGPMNQTQCLLVD